METAGRRVLRWVVLATGVGLLVAAGFVAFLSWPRPVNLGVVPSVPLQPDRPRSLGALFGSRPPALEPRYLEIPALGVKASIEPVEMDPAGSLGVPSNPQVLGWWASGPLPGAATGTAVIDGHVDTAAQGKGALFQLRTLKPGDEIVVRGEARSLRFRIAGLRQYSKVALPVAEAFSRSVVGRLAIVTCGGPFDVRAGHYQDNVIAYALPEAVSLG